LLRLSSLPMIGRELSPSPNLVASAQDSTKGRSSLKYNGKGVGEMVGIIIVSHGRLAEALIASVQDLIGNLKKIRAICVWPRENEKEIKERIQKQMAEIDDGDGVLILTDILGGTPTNLTLPLVEEDKVEVVTGVNVPMLVTVSSYWKGRSLKEIAALVKKSGRRSIVMAKKVLSLKRSLSGR
jgi:mannose PTS system EIIA component